MAAKFSPIEFFSYQGVCKSRHHRCGASYLVWLPYPRTVGTKNGEWNFSINR
jgi:hypothetical protein